MSTIKTDTHPCFSAQGRKNASQVHLPVAPRAMARIRFSHAPAPKPAILPMEAVNWLDGLLEQGTPVDMVGITGPGDPLAVPGPTLETLGEVRRRHPGLPLCLTTLGIGGAEVAAELAGLSLSHVTVLVDAISPEVAAALYAWVRPSTKTLPLEQGVDILLREQAEAIRAFKAAGLTVKVNTTVYPGVNDSHVEGIARAVKELGADIMRVVPYSPTPENEGEMDAPGPDMMVACREAAAKHMELATGPDRCGNDVVGGTGAGGQCAPGKVLPRPSRQRPNVAVCSTNGFDVDLHLGHAAQFLVYGPEGGYGDGLVSLIEARPAPEPGSGDSRWKAAASVLSDCFALLTSSAGVNPRKILSEEGVTVLLSDGTVEGAVEAVYGGGKKQKCKK